MKLDPTQVAAVDHAVSHRFSIITGGAGTGKTTIIKEMVARLAKEKKPVHLCAFAGKAAARLKEATGRETSTIHRLLGYNGVKFTNPTLAGSTVIVDEASMVDSELMAAIIMRKPDRLILVGDEAQLPPVGKGQPFHDIIIEAPNMVYNLTKCFRNREAVFKAATAIRNGESLMNFDQSPGERWCIAETGDAKQTHEYILKLVEDDAFDFDQDIILCPKNGDSEAAPCTVKSLNEDIAEIVNPRDPDDGSIKVGDRVINTKNVAEKDIWNGTTGTVQAIGQKGDMHIELDVPTDENESTVHLTRDEAKNLKLAYALTVHKSQGSQYRRVMFVALGRDQHALLTRSLIYTAVTRTREMCAVVGEHRAFQRGRMKVTSKRTVIQELSKQEVA
ncbi:MAG: AAA family ATPase [Verrucomicrobiota bacterium]